MSRFAARRIRRHKPEAGARPGTLVISPESPAPRIAVIDYTREQVREMPVHDVASLAPLVTPESVTWIDVQGFGNKDLLQAIGKVFQIHPLALEDVVNIPQRPKVDKYQHYTLFVCQMAMPRNGGFEMEQISLLLGPAHVITFQERHGDIFDVVRKRIRERAGLIRTMGADYLAYAIIDRLVDGYFPILDGLGERMERLEEEILSQPRPALMGQLHDVRRDLIQLRRILWSQRDALNMVMRQEESPFSEAVRLYMRDVYDHAVQLLDMVESYREMAVGLMDIYLSSVSNRMNEIMKVLTIMASIFIPLTFIAGVYGMNFEYMPELHQRWAYPLVWGAMVVTAAGLLYYFRRRGWLGDRASQDERDRSPR